MSKTKAGIAALAVCGAACAGAAVLPMLLGGAAAGGAMAALEGETALVVLLGLGGWAAYFWLRPAREASCGCDAGNTCAADGTSCHLPDPGGSATDEPDSSALGPRPVQSST